MGIKKDNSRYFYGVPIYLGTYFGRNEEECDLEIIKVIYTTRSNKKTK